MFTQNSQHAKYFNLHTPVLVWERYGENESICNYWEFLSEADKQVLESE